MLNCCCYCCAVLSCAQLFAIPWTGAQQAPLSMGFYREDYWNGLPFPSPGDLPNPGIESASLTSPALAGGFLFLFFSLLCHLGSPNNWYFLWIHNLWSTSVSSVSRGLQNWNAGRTVLYNDLWSMAMECQVNTGSAPRTSDSPDENDRYVRAPSTPGGQGTPDSWTPTWGCWVNWRRNQRQWERHRSIQQVLPSLNLALSYPFLKMTNKSFSFQTQKHTFET